MNQAVREKAVAEWVDEAALLWLRREHLIAEPHLRLADLALRDARLQTRPGRALGCRGSGLASLRSRIGLGRAGRVVSRYRPRHGDPHSRTHGDRTGLRSASCDLARPVISGLAWTSLDKIVDLVEDCLTSDDPRLKQIGLAAALAHRCLPQSALSDAICHHDSALRARGAVPGRWAARSCYRRSANYGPIRTRKWPAPLPGPAHCVAAAPEAIEQLWAIARDQPSHSLQAIACAVRLVDPADAARRLERLGDSSATRRTAILGTGALGNPSLVDWLISWLPFPETARLAGEAIATITGSCVNSGPPGGGPADEGSAPTASAGTTEEGLEFEPDEHLPWPRAAEVADWWTQHRSAFRDGTRYLCGRPLDAPWCRTVLQSGRQRERVWAALELAALHPLQPLFETRAPACRQQAELCVREHRLGKMLRRPVRTDLARAERNTCSCRAPLWEWLRSFPAARPRARP